MRVSLFLRALFATAGFVLLLVAVFVATGVWQYNALSMQIRLRSIDNAQVAQAYVLTQKQARLRELSDVLLGDAHFTSYMTQAIGSSTDTSNVVDTASIQDLLEQRRNDLGIDSAAIIDGSGRIIVAVGDGLAGIKDLSTTALIRQSSQGKMVAGTLEIGQRVLWASIAPLPHAEASNAKLLTALRLDGTLMHEVARVSNAEVALIATTETERRVVAMSVPAAIAPRVQMAAAGQSTAALAAATNPLVAPMQWDLGGGSWTVRAAALPGAEGLLFVTLGSPAASAATMAPIIRPLAAALVVLLACLVGALMFFQRAFFAPISNLTMLSERAVTGDYDMVYRGRTTGAMGRLGGVFNHLLNDLRQFRPAPGGPRRRSTDRK